MKSLFRGPKVDSKKKGKVQAALRSGRVPAGPWCTESVPFPVNA
jgi:hypothetical protein